MDTRKVASEFRLTQWTQMIQGRLERQQSIKAFCQEAGMSENTYYYWQRKVRQALCERVTGNTAGTPSAGIATRGFSEVKLVEAHELPASAGKAESGRLQVETGEIKIVIDSSYPPEKLAALLRGITRS